MKLIRTHIHHARVAAVIQALADAGLRKLVVLDVKGTLPLVFEKERDYSIETSELFISEAQLDLVCEDDEVATATAIIRKQARIGPRISGWIYVFAIEEALAIDATD